MSKTKNKIKFFDCQKFVYKYRSKRKHFSFFFFALSLTSSLSAYSIKDLRCAEFICVISNLIDFEFLCGGALIRPHTDFLTAVLILTSRFHCDCSLSHAAPTLLFFYRNANTSNTSDESNWCSKFIGTSLGSTTVCYFRHSVFFRFYLRQFVP